MEISVFLPHTNALVPGIGRFYVRGSNSAWESRSETVSTNFSVQEGVTAGRTQSPFVIPQHPEPKTLNLLDLLSSLGPNPLRVNEGHTYLCVTSRIHYNAWASTLNRLLNQRP